LLADTTISCICQHEGEREINHKSGGGQLGTSQISGGPLFTQAPLRIAIAAQPAAQAVKWSLLSNHFIEESFLEVAI